MNIILLSGGSGKRLWPLSNETRSKQFLRLLGNDSGEKESMVQRVYRQIHEAGIDAHIVIATGKAQIDPIHSQLGDAVDVVTEPARRDTFPAIALACAHLVFERNLPLDEPVVIMPVDPYAESGYFSTLITMERTCRENTADIVLMGIEPTYPSEKYGYIIPDGKDTGPNGELYYRVSKFTEKPSLTIAQELLARGAYWNGGVFAVKLGYVMNIVDQYIKAACFDDVYRQFERLERISFDYAVVEKADSIAMIPYCGKWKDLGTWNTLSEEMGVDSLGSVIMGEECNNTTVINELGIPIVALGLKDVIVAASPDGILVSDKGASSYLKPYMDQISERPMFEERRWGEYRVIDYIQYGNGMRSLTKHMTLRAGKSISYQTHVERDEIWTVVSGEGEVVLNGMIQPVSAGSVIHIPHGMLHCVRAWTDLHFIEVQIGTRLEEEDIERFDWEWDL
jgi:mannose-1-phosphate guanylyltransferase